jgi:hypothetical protein
MNRIRYLVAGLLCLSGAIHVTQLFVGRPVAETIITVSFGVAYLAIGGFLFGGSKTSDILGATIPLIGLLLATAGMLMNPTLLGAFFIAIDVIVAVYCLTTIVRSKQSSRV